MGILDGDASGATSLASGDVPDALDADPLPVTYCSSSGSDGSSGASSVFASPLRTSSPGAPGKKPNDPSHPPTRRASMSVIDLRAPLRRRAGLIRLIRVRPSLARSALFQEINRRSSQAA